MSLTDDITKVENDLRKLVRLWERFFAGDLRVPPQLELDRYGNRLRSLSGKQMQRRADQFRFEQLQHRFMSYATNWERMLREREEGRGRFAGAGTLRQSAPPPDTVGSGSVDTSENGLLYDRYLAAKREVGQEVAIDRASFESQMASKKTKLAARLGEDIQFDVLVEDGKVKLAARRRRQTEQQE